MKKPRFIVITGKEKEFVKEIILRLLKPHFKIGKDVFIFEAEEKKIDKFTFFFKNSKLPVLTFTDPVDNIGLFKNLPGNVNFILNLDNEFENLIGFKKIKFGMSKKNDVFASDIVKSGQGINFKINYKGSSVPFWLPFGISLYPVLSAVCLGIIFDLNLVEISESLKEMKIG